MLIIDLGIKQLYGKLFSRSRSTNVEALKLSTVSHSLRQQILSSVLSRDLCVFSHVTTSD